MILRHRDKELLKFEWIDQVGLQWGRIFNASSRLNIVDMSIIISTHGGWRLLSSFSKSELDKCLILVKKADEYLKLSEKCGGINRKISDLDGGIKENLLADPFLTVAGLAELLHVALRTIERRMKALRESGAIVRCGARKKGSWIVRC